MNYQNCEDKIKAKIIALTLPVVDYIPDSEGLISYCARVSNEGNQLNFDTSEGLLNYCIRNAHWSIFEMSNVVVEIKVPRDISRQVLRHRTSCFQEFSQRYAEVSEDMFCIRETRLQDTKDRQNSVLCEDEGLDQWWYKAQENHINNSKELYELALSRGLAKEVARVVLPEGNTMSTLYMNANMRTWLHYLKVRSGNGTQKEHIWLTDVIREAMVAYMPTLISKVTGV